MSSLVAHLQTPGFDNRWQISDATCRDEMTFAMVTKWLIANRYVGIDLTTGNGAIAKLVCSGRLLIGMVCH